MCGEPGAAGVGIEFLGAEPQGPPWLVTVVCGAEVFAGLVVGAVYSLGIAELSGEGDLTVGEDCAKARSEDVRSVIAGNAEQGVGLVVLSEPTGLVGGGREQVECGAVDIGVVLGLAGQSQSGLENALGLGVFAGIEQHPAVGFGHFDVGGVQADSFGCGSDSG